MKKLITVTLILIALTLASSACAEVQFREELYLKTVDLDADAFVICRDEFGTEYDNSAEPTPLKINKEDGYYVVHFYRADPENTSKIGTRYLHENELLVRYEETIVPTIQEIMVCRHYRWTHNREESKIQVNTMYLLTLPKDNTTLGDE